MTTSPVPNRRLSAAIGRASEALSEVAELDPIYCSTADKGAALQALVALQGKVAELTARVLTSAADVAEQAGAKDASTWLTATTRIDRRHARSDLELGKALTRYERLAAALRTGRVNTDQAQVIARSLEELPDDITDNVRLAAETELTRLAAQFDPRELRNIGRQILQFVAPEEADQAEARALEREEVRAREKCNLRIRPHGDGTSRITGLLPDTDAARLRTSTPSPHPESPPGSGSRGTD